VAQSDFITRTGLPLNEAQIAIARSVGVAHPELIKILEVDALPIPEVSELRQAAQTSGLFSPDMAGLTRGHGIYIRHGQAKQLACSHMNFVMYINTNRQVQLPISFHSTFY